MKVTATATALLAAVVLAACASSPAIVVLPGTGTTLEQFTADDAACRAWTSRQAGTSSQWRYDAAYTQCMYARGHKVPVYGGGWQQTSSPSAPASSPPPEVPPPPPGTPPPPPPGPSR